MSTSTVLPFSQSQGREGRVPWLSFTCLWSGNQHFLVSLALLFDGLSFSLPRYLSLCLSVSPPVSLFCLPLRFCSSFALFLFRSSFPCLSVSHSRSLFHLSVCPLVSSYVHSQLFSFSLSSSFSAAVPPFALSLLMLSFLPLTPLSLSSLPLRRLLCLGCLYLDMPDLQIAAWRICQGRRAVCSWRRCSARNEKDSASAK